MKKNTPHLYFWLGHILFWIAYITLNYYLIEGRFNNTLALRRTLTLAAIQIPMVYINIFILIPKLFAKKKYVWFILAEIALLVATVFIFEFVIMFAYDFFFEHKPFYRGFRRQRIPGIPGPHSIFNYLLTLFLLLLSTIIELAIISSKKEKEAAQMRSETLNSELKFLRSQINPHFLFNTLNNLYSLAVLKSKKTPEVILKLSEMLRYNLYDANDKELVSVQQEAHYIQNYITLFQLKDDNQLENIQVKVTIEQELYIAPMLLIPFVENAFKHSKIEDREKAWISISLTVKDGTLHFIVENSMPTDTFYKDKTGGIGIENVRRRLELIYPEKYTLSIENKETFKVALTLKPEKPDTK